MVTRTDDRTRGQVILIGAIALAFIILGVVVVFNGVLYTETVSSGPSSQSASDANVTTAEVEQNVGCLLAALNDAGSYSPGDEGAVEDEIDDLSERYQETNARSRPAVISTESSDVTIDGTTNEIVEADVTITYDSHELSYTRKLEGIEPDDDCLEGSP